MKTKLQIGIYFVTTLLAAWFSTVRGMQDTCIDGCSAHRLRGVNLPLYDFPHRIAVWQNESGIVAIFPEENGQTMWILPTQGNWTNINTSHSDGQFCVSVEGVSEKLCHPTIGNVMLRTKPATEVLWKFDCDGASCGCRHYHFDGIGFSPKDLPTNFYFRPETTTSHLFFILGSELRNITMKQRPRWHDLSINYVIHETGVAFEVSSRSLGIRNVTFTGSEDFWLFIVNGGDTVPTRFNLGCQVAPPGIMENKQGSCIDGCSVHRFSGVSLPLSDFPHRISLWQIRSTLVVGFSEKIGEYVSVQMEGWTNISTYRFRGQYCVEVQGVSEKTLCHHYDDDIVLRTSMEIDSFWKIDCHGDSCGCREHLLVGIAFTAKDLPTKLYFKPEYETEDLWLVLGLYITRINLPQEPKWHDITIDYIMDEAGSEAFVVNSLSLEVRNWILNSSDIMWLLAGRGDESPPFRIGLGCEEAPKTSSSDIEEIHHVRMWKCASKNPNWAPGLILFAVPVIIMGAWFLGNRKEARRKDTLRENFELQETLREGSTTEKGELKQEDPITQISTTDDLVSREPRQEDPVKDDSTSDDAVRGEPRQEDHVTEISMTDDPVRGELKEEDSVEKESRI